MGYHELTTLCACTKGIRELLKVQCTFIMKHKISTYFDGASLENTLGLPQIEQRYNNMKLRYRPKYEVKNKELHKKMDITKTHN